MEQDSRGGGVSLATDRLAHSQCTGLSEVRGKQFGMSKRIIEIQESVASGLNGLPGVFSTVQRGGRAYKVGDSRKFKLLSHVCLSDAGDAVYVGFKLTKDRAREVVDQHDWITPHSFRTLAGSGWVAAEVRTKSQCKVIAKLLAESRALYPVHETVKPRKGKRGVNDDDGVVQRIGAVLRERKAAGWSPNHADGFDD